MTDVSLAFIDLKAWGPLLLSGALITIKLALSAFPLGVALGLIVALGTLSQRVFFRSAAAVYTTIFRGIPELLALFLVYYGLPLALNPLDKALGANGLLSLSPFASGTLALGTICAAFSAEVWVGAIRSVPKGQTEAALSLGLTNLQTLLRVTGPQFTRYALPGLGNNWMVLLKDTSLISVVTLHDVIFFAKRASLVTHKPFLFFTTVLAIYLFFSLISASALSCLKRATSFPTGARSKKAAL